MKLRFLVLALTALSVWPVLTSAQVKDDPALIAILEPIRVKYHLPALAGAIFTADGVVDMAAVGVRKMRMISSVVCLFCFMVGSYSFRLEPPTQSGPVSGGLIKISNIDITGHGSAQSQTFGDTDADESLENSFIGYQNGVFLTTSNSPTAPRIPISSILGNKMAPRATINLHGCETGQQDNGGNNIAKALSQAVGVTVTGVNGVLDTQFGAPVGTFGQGGGNGFFGFSFGEATSTYGP